MRGRRARLLTQRGSWLRTFGIQRSRAQHLTKRSQREQRGLRLWQSQLLVLAELLCVLPATISQHSIETRRQLSDFPKVHTTVSLVEADSGTTRGRRDFDAGNLLVLHGALCRMRNLQRPRLFQLHMNKHTKTFMTHPDPLDQKLSLRGETWGIAPQCFN